MATSKNKNGWQDDPFNNEDSNNTTVTTSPVVNPENTISESELPKVSSDIDKTSQYITPNNVAPSSITIGTPDDSWESEKADLVSAGYSPEEVEYFHGVFPKTLNQNNEHRVNREDYTRNKDWFDMWGDGYKPMTQAQREKREKAAKRVAAIGHIGAAIAGLANMVGTAHGAQSMTLPDTSKLNPDLRTFNKEEDAKAMQYARLRADANSQDMAEYRAALTDAQRRDIAAYNTNSRLLQDYYKTKRKDVADRLSYKRKVDFLDAQFAKKKEYANYTQSQRYELAKKLVDYKASVSKAFYDYKRANPLKNDNDWIQDYLDWDVDDDVKFTYDRNTNEWKMPSKAEAKKRMDDYKKGKTKGNNKNQRSNKTVIEGF